MHAKQTPTLATWEKGRGGGSFQTLFDASLKMTQVKILELLDELVLLLFRRA